MFTIRNAQLTDAAAIAAIYNHAIQFTTATFDTEIKSIQNRTEWLKQHGPNYPVLVALSDDNVIAFASLSRWSDRPAYDQTAELSIYIQQNFQNIGLGNILMPAIIKEGRKACLHTIISRITQGNEISIHLHQKYGFTHVGVLKEAGKKFEQWLDVTIMQLMY
jgi:L-amino acid N-acyltransferase YncA